MDAAFRMRLRKPEGVTKKGPLVAKHSLGSHVSVPQSPTNVAATNMSMGHAKEIRSPVGPGPPVGSQRRRPSSPDPRNMTRKGGSRDSPKTSPVRSHYRDRSPSPTNQRRIGPRVPYANTPLIRGGRPPGAPPSPPTKRVTPPTSPRIRRPQSPVRKTPVTPQLRTPGDGSSKSSWLSSSKAPSVPSPALNTRPPSPAGSVKHPQSPTNSRPASPRGRGASPGSRPPPISEEALKTRVNKALKARLYLLHQPGPNSFSVGGDSPSHKYKVIIGPQTCSCGHSPYCIHVLFVMVRVLQLSQSDPLLMSGSLKDYEVEQLLRCWEERRKKAIRARERRTGLSLVGGGSKDRFLGKGSSKGGLSPPSSPTRTLPPGSESSCDEDLQCPICLMTMVEGESLVACEAGCRNSLHHHCMAVWAADRHAQGQPLLCPLCRAPWPSKNHPRVNPPRSVPSYVGYAANDQHACSFNPSYSVMSASLSGICGLGGGRKSSAQSPSSTMSRSLTSAYPTNRPRNLRSQADSAYSSPLLGRSPVYGYPPTVRGEVSYPIADEIPEEMIPLPRSDPIPSEHEEAASTWIYVFGRELIACLFSRDWAVRETGLRRLTHEVVKVLHWDYLVTSEQMQQKVIHCCANILAQVANDPVYKVYIACLRCVRVLLSLLCPTEDHEVSALQELLRPLLHTLLLKCADGNRRTSQISIDSIVELCRGQDGELALGTQSNGVSLTPGLGGISFVLSCILDDSAPSEAPWQWLLGRLCVLDRLLDEFPHEFQLQTVQLNPSESGYKLQHYDRLMTVVEYAFKALGSSHATVSKLARRIYICGARMAAAEPAVFHQVCDMLSKLDVSLQMRLKRRLKSMQGSHGERRSSLARLGDKFSLASKENLNGPRLVRSVSHSPSRMLSILRSSSQSPARPGLLMKPSASEECVPEKPIRRPDHLPLNSFDVKFKEKQNKLRLYHKSKAKRDHPLIVQQVLISPRTRDKQISKSKSQNYSQHPRGGFSQSFEDDLDISPQSPVDNTAKFSFKDAVSKPTTPSAPYTTPVYDSAEKCSRGCCCDPGGRTLPVIPGLDLVPKYLDETADADEQITESTGYVEGKEWVKGQLLGTGAFSSCYQARDIETGALMAVKQLSICRNSEEEQERVEATVEDEILMMSRLHHTNIVRLLGATRVGFSFSLFSEWMAGGSVSAMLDKYGPFSETVMIRYTKQILAGLSYLHDNMILHRDLKGANLLVDSTGQNLRIGDFGTATKLASRSTVPGEFQGQLLGTIAFMAPEVLRGDNYGRACDMWSIGCCIIEMATTKPPWGADNVSNQYKLMFRIASSTEPPPLPDTLSAATRDIAMKCLQLNSEDRPTAKQFLRQSVFNNQPP